MNWETSNKAHEKEIQEWTLMCKVYKEYLYS
jgi:hypothetical protein